MMFKRNKITIIGAGATGATTAHVMALKELGDIVLVDVAPGIPEGKALDIWEAGPIERFSLKVVGTTDYELTRDSDIIVVTAGMPRKPGMSRDDLLKVNAEIVHQVVAQASQLSPNAILVILSNPADVMAYVAQKASGFPYHRVIGQAGVLDSARFRAFLADALQVSPKDVTAFVMGGHGDDMVPLVRYSSVGGIPVEKLLPQETLNQIVQRTRTGGGEVLNLMKISAFYAPASSLAEMVEAILKDERRVIPVISYLDGEYGEHDIFVGVPAIVGGNGIEKVLEVEFTDEERAAFAKSVAAVRKPLSMLNY
ncbi:malate dehydrogenase [Sulfobacillus thermosulfidooxidans]|uniref:Malate dehydrogenase n=2 Tax=Sulfobacillus thermosulfidooxidans TaxID=28034 RepID=A0A1W1W6L6_SULTA|nr:malate dehydrogenase [Sulfobacillus thermosulfidooxidans]OLZ15844.1 malate dehydrogenase [Sulfobacillus thermosulfidooxidans]OLZ18309.1 malate dehydrogenase [Sulfobacillus thermosulfidooxidans]SMC01700.1 malate dehydrogenase (NAD) [Sulfobacillus thermosulfidooxidans DSM 9293]